MEPDFNSYTSLYNNLEDGVALCNQNGRVVHANPAFCNLLGYTLREIQQLTYPEFTVERWHRMEEEFLEEILAGNPATRPYVKEYIHKDGSIIPVRIRSWAITSIDGEYMGLWAIIQMSTQDTVNIAKILHDKIDALNAVIKSLRGE